MAIQLICDLCGLPITEEDAYVNIDVTTGHRTGPSTEARARRFTSGWLGHYHADGGEGKDCYDRLDDLVQMVRSQARALSGIPVATEQEVAGARGRPRVSTDSGPQPGYDVEIAHHLLTAVPGLSPRARWALARKRIDLERAATMSDDELLFLDQVGPAAVRKLREAIERDGGR